MKGNKHTDAYGIIIRNNQIVLINKKNGPFDGLLDLPGGSLKYGERPEDALKRELKEELGIKVLKYKLLDVLTTVYKKL